NGPSSLPFLDRLIARDPFDPRPLIWKAEILRTTGHPDAAESAARSALGVDPTDLVAENTGLKAGDVLAELLESRGKALEAEPYRRRARAFALAEEGDQLQAAGLTKRAA